MFPASPVYHGQGSQKCRIVGNGGRSFGVLKGGKRYIRHSGSRRTSMATVIAIVLPVRMLLMISRAQLPPVRALLSAKRDLPGR